MQGATLARFRLPLNPDTPSLLPLTGRHEELLRTAGGKTLRSFPWLLSPLVADIQQLWERFKKLDAVLARQITQEEGEAMGHLWGRLSILLQCGNAAILGNHVPTRPADVVY